jgi:mycothiol synthase
VDGYRIRPARRDDLEAVARLVIAADLADYGRTTFTAADVEEFWTRPRFTLERDSWMIEATDDGSLAGYGYVWVREGGVHIIAIGVVHPDHRGRGVGTRLADAMDARAVELASGATGVVVSSAFPAEDLAARSLVTSRGYTFDRIFWQMEKPLDALDDVAVGDPPGVAIEPAEPGSRDEAVHALIEESFRDHWRFRHEPIEEWRERLLARGRTVWLVARAGDDRIAGALVGWVEDELGRVDQLGVLEGCRRRGIGEALLRRAFAQFVGMGATNAELSVDSSNETGATALYERVGMSVTMAYVFFDKTIS